MIIPKDRVKQYTSTTGSGDITFSRSFNGYQTFANAFSSGDSTYYCIENRGSWEVGLGTYGVSGPNTLSRDTVLASSTGSKLSLNGGSTVFCTLPASKILVNEIVSPASGEVLLYDGTKWINSSTAGYTNEQAQDAVAAMLTGSGNITTSYNDAANVFTISGTGLLARTNNLSDLVSVSVARANLGLGSAALSNTGDFYLSTNPSGYITASAVAAGYQPLDGDLSSLSAATGVNTIYYRSASNTWSPVAIGSGLVFNSGTLINTLDLSPYATTASVASTYVPLTRTITINGSGLDLTSNRSWTVGDLRSDSTYSDPAWLTSLAWSKISGTPTTLAGYGITDGITSVAVAAGYQPLDSDLTAIAGLTTTSYGRSLLTQADAPTARTTLGLGTLATQNGTFSGTSSGTNTGDQTITLTGDVTGTGTGSFATTISAGAVTNSMLAGSIAISKLAITGTPDGTKFLRDDGTWQTVSGGGSGITSLGGQTGATQTFQTATTGTDFTISSTGDVHTFAIPDASASARGLVTTGSQTFSGTKTFRGTTQVYVPLTPDTGSSTIIQAWGNADLEIGASAGNRSVSIGANGLRFFTGSRTATGLLDVSTAQITLGTSGVLLGGTNQIEQRNSTNAQTFNISNTWTSSTNFEYGRFQWNTNEFRIGTAVGSAGGTQRDIVLGNWNSAGTWTPAITLGASGVNTVRLDNTYCYMNSSTSGYGWNLYTRYGQVLSVGNNGICHAMGSFTLTDNTYGPQIQYTTSIPGRGNFGATPTARAWLVGGSGGSYASSTNRHHGVGWAAWCGIGATPTDTNANGGNAGTFDIWLNAGGPGNGTGAAGSDGKFRIVNDATDTEVFSIDVSGNLILTTTNGSKIGTSTTQKLGFWNATPVVQNTGWSTSNSSSRKTIDATATNLNELIDLVCTLVETLKSYGIIGA